MTAPERKLQAQSATEQLKLAAGEEEKHKLNNIWLQQEEGLPTLHSGSFHMGRVVEPKIYKTHRLFQLDVQVLHFQQLHCSNSLCRACLLIHIMELNRFLCVHKVTYLFTYPFILLPQILE